MTVKNYYRIIVRNLRKIVKCGICGHRQKLQFHHIKPTKVNGESRGSAMRAYDIVKHPDCYIPLCFFCHKKVTSEEIRIYEPTHAIMWWSDSGKGIGEIHVI